MHYILHMLHIKKYASIKTYSSTSQLRMGKIQNGSLYVRFRSSKCSCMYIAAWCLKVDIWTLVELSIKEEQ